MHLGGWTLRLVLMIDFLDNQEFNISWVILLNTLLWAKFRENTQCICVESLAGCWQIWHTWLSILSTNLFSWDSSFWFLWGFYNEPIIWGERSDFNRTGFLTIFITRNAKYIWANTFYALLPILRGSLLCLFELHLLWDPRQTSPGSHVIPKIKSHPEATANDVKLLNYLL